MLLFNNKISKISRSFIAILALLILNACQFQPLHGDRAAGRGGGLEHVGVDFVDSRVAQQVRNHLLFLFNGGFASTEKTHEVKLSVRSNDKQTSSLPSVEDSTAGTVTVIVNYEIIDLKNQEILAKGKRDSAASYDRTGQVFANNRAVRDAENRAAKEAAEAVRLAVSAHMSNL